MSASWFRIVGALALATVGGGCTTPIFYCHTDANCLAHDAGACEPSGFCSFPSEECDSGRVFGDLAPSSVAGSCVPADDAGVGTEPTPEESGADDDTATTLATTEAASDASGPIEDSSTGAGGTAGAGCEGREGQPCRTEQGCPGELTCGASGDWICRGTARVPTTLDVLFVIDDSAEMGPGHDRFADQTDALLRGIMLGDSDDDGVSDFVPPQSVHLGFITASMDVGPASTLATGCAPRDIGDGVVYRRPGCGEAGYVLEGLGALEASSSLTRCQVLDIGDNGCMFEQPLEALLKALSPSTDKVSFPSGSGHADGLNADFRRPDSPLLVILITNEDDCSAPLDFFDPDNAALGQFGSRCARHERGLHTLSRFVFGLENASLPEQTVVVGMVGLPMGVTTQTHDLGQILSMAELTPSFSPGGASLPVCETSWGSSLPAQRIVQFASAIEGRGTQVELGSFCDLDSTVIPQLALPGLAALFSPTCG